MSEEEMKKETKNILEDRNMLIDTLYENYRQRTVKPFYKTIEGLWNLYESEEEKISILTEFVKKEQELKLDKKFVKEEQELKLDKRFVGIKFISKDKIREKIKELEKMKQNEVDEFVFHSISWGILDYLVEQFKELLKEQI